MGIWIRSQDLKELINTNRVQVEVTGIYTFTPNDAEKSWIRIGGYDTPERAIEVLDEIQKCVFEFENEKLYNLSPLERQMGNLTTIYPVYEMPQE